MQIEATIHTDHSAMESIDHILQVGNDCNHASKILNFRLAKGGQD